jgi:hypothetical protein
LIPVSYRKEVGRGKVRGKISGTKGGSDNITLPEVSNSTSQGRCIMKRMAVLSVIFLLVGCGYGMRITKSVPPLPSDVSGLKIVEIEDIRRMGRRGEYIGRGSFVRNILINELKNSNRVTVDDDSSNQLIVKIEDYNPSYHKYIALSARILNTSTNQTVWNASISGLSKKPIDEVTQSVLREMVKEMAGGMLPHPAK